jgi:hypothetical protein
MRLALLHPVLGEGTIIDELVSAQLFEHPLQGGFVHAGPPQPAADLIFTSGPLG